MYGRYPVKPCSGFDRIMFSAVLNPNLVLSGIYINLTTTKVMARCDH